MHAGSRRRNEPPHGENFITIERFDIVRSDDHDLERFAKGVCDFQDEAFGAATRMGHDVDDCGNVAALEIMVVQVARQGDTFIQGRFAHGVTCVASG